MTDIVEIPAANPGFNHSELDERVPTSQAIASTTNNRK